MEKQENTPALKAPRVGLEPTTLRLTAECSTIELSRIIPRHGFPPRSRYFLRPPGRLPYLQNCIYSFQTPRNSMNRFQTPRNSMNRSTPQLRPLASLPRFPDLALDRLVTVSSMHCCTSTSALSTSSSSRGLTSFEWEFLSQGGLHA